VAFPASENELQPELHDARIRGAGNAAERRRRRHAREWVTVTGVVRRFVASEVERTVSGFDWGVPDEVVVQFDERPSIVASSVVPSTKRPATSSAVSATTARAADAHVSIE
jgi:hypothetical protein